MNTKNNMIWDLVGALREIRCLLRQPAGNSTDLALKRWIWDSAELLDEAEALLDREAGSI